MSDVGLHNEQALIENDISEQHENKKKMTKKKMTEEMINQRKQKYQ